MYCLSERGGKAATPPESLSALGKMRQRMEADRTLFQIQLWTVADRDLNDSDLQVITPLFEHLRSIILAELSRHGESSVGGADQ